MVRRSISQLTAIAYAMYAAAPAPNSSACSIARRTTKSSLNVSVITNSVENCNGMVLLPYTVIMPARKVTSTSTTGSTRGNGVTSATISVTAVHSSTLASISLNL